MHIDDRIVVEGRLLGRSFVGEIEIVRPCVLPPRAEGLSVEIRAVLVVEESQTETRSGQSQWPDLRVLSVAPDGRRLPLTVQVGCNLRV